MEMENLQKVLLVFTIIGAINWLLVGLFNFDLVATIFGVRTIVTNIIYTIVGICGICNIWILFSHMSMERRP